MALLITKHPLSPTIVIFIHLIRYPHHHPPPRHNHLQVSLPWLRATQAGIRPLYLFHFYYLDLPAGDTQKIG